MKTRVGLKYFVNDCSLRFNSSRSLHSKSFIYTSILSALFLHRKVKRSTIQIYNEVCLNTRFDAPYFQLVQQIYTKLESLVTMRLLESDIA